jgi:aminoglycoside 3-N-acetyltransferase I
MKRDLKTVEIKRLDESDLPRFKSLIDLFNMVFEENRSNIGNDAHLSRLLGDPQFIAMVALAEQEVAGGLTAYELPLYYANHSEVFLYDMAVKQEYQRMGIGKELIRSLKEQCRGSGVKEFFVLAHEEDEHAIEFYHSTGGKSEKVVNFLYETSE